MSQPEMVGNLLAIEDPLIDYSAFDDDELRSLQRQVRDEINRRQQVARAPELLNELTRN